MDGRVPSGPGGVQSSPCGDLSARLQAASYGQAASAKHLLVCANAQKSLDVWPAVIARTVVGAGEVS